MAVETMAMYSDADLSSAANQVKELVVKTMTNKGLISKSDAEAFMASYAVLVVKRGWLGSSIDKVLGLEENDSKRFAMVDVTINKAK